MLNLEEKKAALQRELGALNAQLDDLKRRLISGSPATSAHPVATKAGNLVKSASPKTAKARRGELKSAIFSALEKAGSSGVKVLDLAKSLRAKPANVYAWFHAATKRYPGSIEKTGAAAYKLIGKPPEAKPKKAKPGKVKRGKSAKPIKAATKKTKGKARGNARGALAAKIVATLQAAGPSGMTVKDLSTKLNTGYRNLLVWFVTTGKGYPAIKKIAPATYSMTS